MYKLRFKTVLLGFLLLAVDVWHSYAQQAYNPSLFINTEINTGDPAYPFPQFLEYKGGGKSLAKYNAEGVTHADMEKAMREAYEIMMHRCRYMGGTHCGVKYITFNHGSVPHNYGTFVSEGDGYALLAAAIFADQKTFNGLYMWVHDNRFSGTPRFQDGRMLRANDDAFAGPYLAGWQCDETTTSMSPCHSATDGDVDIAMAMLIAYKQWGEWMKQDGEIVKDYAGNPISLKYEAQRVIGALVDTIGQIDKGSHQLTGMINGVIGIDGYEKRGNSWGELTRWRFTDEANAMYPGVNGPYNVGPNLYGIYGGNYIDYDAPSYFEEFWRWLKNGDGVDEKNKAAAEWEIHQFKRAAASGNWLNKKAYDKGYYASIGRVEMTTDGDPTFDVYVDGEDFRYAWRHLMDYLWHGNADYDWDPKKHQVIDGVNTSERDMGIRHAKLLKEPSEKGSVICSKMGASPDPGQPQWFGVSQIPQQWALTGAITSAYHTNYSVGAGSPAAVISEDLELLADIYRQCEIMWDGNNTEVGYYDEERYMGSTPKYFHGWFRTLGMLVCSGNLAAPEDMKPIANAKVYMSVDKTYAYQGDNVKYGVQFRNYGTLDAEGVVIKTKLDPNYQFVSATGGGQYDAASHSIKWEIGKISGFKTGKLAATMDSVFFVVNVADTLNKRICLTSTISGDNFEDWVSNEYPNHATYTMERNCVDILASRSLSLKKTASRANMNPGDVVSFTLEFENKSEGDDSWMNGGRDHVRISYANNPKVQTNSFLQFFRFWNDSYESYINMSNYRVSYFMYDAVAKGLYDASSNPTGWTFKIGNQQDMDKYGYNPPEGPCTFSYQKIPQGEDEYGKWNQRLMIRFANVLMAPSTHVYDKLNGAYLCHKGVYGPGLIRADLSSNPAADIQDRLLDDWSYDGNIMTSDNTGQFESFYPVTPCWADVDNLGYEINNFSRHVCSPSKVKNFDRVLVEEFDGYTWRRIQGRGPLPGKEAYNVTIVDTIPYELEWIGWKDSTALKDDAGNKIKAKYIPSSEPTKYTGIVKWTIPEMLVGESDKLIYTCKARNLGCPDVPDTYYKNVAWIWSDTDSPDSSQVELMTTCNELPPVIDPQTSLFKTADKSRAEVGDNVSYKVKYINKDGTRVVADCKSTAGWKTLGSGSLPKVGNSGLVMSTQNGSYFCAPEYSYGKDGNVFLSVKGASNSSSFYVVFRYTSGTPGDANFKGVCIQLNINNDGQNNLGYTLYDDGKVIESAVGYGHNTQFPGDKDEPTFMFKLQDDHLYMYCNDEEDEWTSVMKDWKIKSSSAGYFGVYTKQNNGDPQLTSFITELDYAFNVTLYDDLPAELGNITHISDGGSLNESTKRITWPTVATTTATALAPEDSVVYTFDAEVVNCNNFITNMGLATVYGLDTLKVLNTIECGSDECNLIKADIVLDETSICDGDSTLLHGYGDDGKDGSRFLYEFFLNDVSLGKASYTSKIYVKKAGSYHVVVTSPVDPTCYLVSDKVELMINDKPVGPDYLVDLVCLNSKALDNAGYRAIVAEVSDREAEGYSFEWYAKDGSILPAMPSPDNETSSGDYTYLYRLISDKGCYSDTAKLYYPIVDTIALMAVDVEMCPKKSVTLSMDAGDVGNSYKWSTGETTQSITVSEPKVYSVEVTTPDGCVSRGSTEVIALDSIQLNLLDVTICPGQSAILDAGSDGTSYLWSDNSTSQTLTTDVAGTYSVVVTASNGCESHATATITVADKLEVDLGADKTVCKADLPYVLDATSNYDSFEWSDGTTGQTLSVTETGTYKVKVTQGTCSGEGEVTVTVSTVDDPVVDHTIAYMVSDTTSSGIFNKSLTQQDATAISYATGTTPKWYDENKNELQTEPIPAVPAGGGNATYIYYTSAVNGDGCESGLIPVKVTVSGAPTPKVQEVSYCLNDPTVTALTAEATPGQDATETWTLRWYDASGTALSGAPTPSVTTAGETTYYVSQVSDVTGAESGRVPVKVNVYGVAKPDVSGNRLQYCAGEPYETVTAQSGSDAMKYLMGDGTFVWTVDGTEVSDPSVSTQKESISYTVKETYTISAGHVCESEAAEFTVRTTFVPEVTGDLTVNYLMKEGESGVFPALDEKNPNVAKTESGFSLVWYETDGKTSSQTAPSPKKDPSWTAGGEQELRYYVKQTDGTCSSDTVTIIVKISDSPMPNTTPVEYCQNATATALTASINDDMEPADQYTLVWYDVTTGDELSEAPVPSTQTAGETTYNVAQRHKTTGATSAKSNIKVTVRALPVLVTQEVPAQCGGAVILSNYIKEASGLAVSQSFYSDATATTQSAEIVTASGTYYSNAYITLTNGEKCYSETSSVEVTINDLSDLTVTGATTACPGGTVTLTATATSQNPGDVTYSWEGGTSGTSGEYTTPAMNGTYGQQFTYTVKASAGACVETLSQTHTVTIDRGVLTGAMTMNGETTKRYKTCGGEPITIETSHTGSDYSWKTLDGQTVSGTTSISVTPTMTTTYVLSLTNVCETSDTVTVEVHPLSVQADWTGLNKTVCEGDAFSASLTLTGYDATQSGSYIRWYKGGEELTAYADQPSLNVTGAKAEDAGIYSYKVSNGVCEMPETEDSGELTVVTPATYTQSEGVVSCSGEAVEISVTLNEADATLLWSDDAMAEVTRTVAPTSNTEYAFTITRSDVCVTKGAVRVDVRKNPSVSIEDVTLCEGGSQTLKATVEGDELTAYSWTDEEGNELGDAETLTVTPVEDARYTLTVTSASCGDASATAKVTVIEVPRLLMDSVGLRSREFQVENLTSSAYEYKVDKSEWQSSGLFENLIYDLLHTAYVRDEYGCEGTLMFIVKAPDYELEPYVTPDDDGVKDKWSVTTLLEIYPNANVIIYDRYGKQLVELKGSDTEWDGTYNGNPLPSTDYWYTVNIPEIDKNYSGHFTLIRSK